jgi:predicted Abi (CAAX) family protease
MQQQTDETMSGTVASRKGSYFRYLAAEYNRSDAYPVGPRPDPALYHPAASWIGRLILPTREKREAVVGALMEVQYAEPAYEHLIGQIVRLRWNDIPETNQRFWSVTRSVMFDREAKQYLEKGYVLPERVNGWSLVNPFESLAGAYPGDEMTVRLPETVVVEEEPADGGLPLLHLPREPIQTTGRFYALVRFLGPSGSSTDRLRVVHYSRESGEFDGPEETVLLPETIPDAEGVQPAVNAEIERSPANEEGWYIYGALDRTGIFVVQSLVPRALIGLRPQTTLLGLAEKGRFFGLREWRKQAKQGTFTSTLLCPEGVTPEAETARWKEGDAALVIHLYGKYLREDWTWQRFLLTWGHFAFGVARVVREPLTGEMRFDIEYHQVYVHGDSGIISGTHHWTRYTGDRQFGFLGTHPTQDVLIRLNCFTEPYPVAAASRSPLTELAKELENMGARYRIADGRGGHRISPANNCSQDSNQALYAVIKRIDFALQTHPQGAGWLANAPDEERRVRQLIQLGRDLKRKLLPFGAARADWELGAPTIGSSLSENPITSLWMAIRTWHTLLPSVAVRHLVGTFLRHGATAWTLRTHQVGGHDPTIEPCVPNV